MTTYNVEYLQNGCIEVSKAFGTLCFYRIPYDLLESKQHDIELPSNFIVYLLKGSTPSHPNVLYVGTSYRGMQDRPTGHENRKFRGEKIDWDSCIIFTTTDGLLNDSTLRFLEDSIREHITNSKQFKSSTKSTSKDGANKKDKRACEAILPTILEVYSILGVDLTPKYPASEDKPVKKKKKDDETPVSPSDFSSLGLPTEMTDWLVKAEKIVSDVDPSAKASVSKLYASYSCGKIFAYWYPLKSKNLFRIYLRGNASDYKNPKVTQRDEKVHNGDCKAEFYVGSEGDLEYFRMFAEIAIQNMKKSR